MKIENRLDFLLFFTIIFLVMNTTTKTQVQSCSFVSISSIYNVSENASDVLDFFFDQSNHRFTFGGNNLSLVDQKTFFQELVEELGDEDDADIQNGLNDIEKFIHDLDYGVFIDLEN